jgi:hypothetical protein
VEVRLTREQRQSVEASHQRQLHQQELATHFQVGQQQVLEA